MRLRKRGLQRVVDKMGSRDSHKDLQRSIICLLTFSFPPHSLLSEVDSGLLNTLLPCLSSAMTKFQSFTPFLKPMSHLKVEQARSTQ